MKTRWLPCALILAFFMMAGIDGHIPAANAAGPVIEITSTNHDFGDVYKLDKFVHDFVVKNVGDADLVIEEVKPG